MAIALAAAGAFIVYQFNGAGKLRDDLAAITAQRNELRGDIATLTAERDGLHSDLATLEGKQSETSAVVADCSRTAETAMRVGAQWRELDSLEAAWLATPEGSQEEADIGAKMDEQLYLIRDTSIGLVVLAESCLGSGSLDGFDVEKAEAGRL